MKILVTGGAGFIGSNVVDGYINEGHEVVIIDNLSTGKMENVNKKAKFYLMDLCSKECSKVFEIERPDVVNHHGAQISVPASVDNPMFDANINILGFLNIMQLSVKFGVKKFIFISSGGAVYGEAGDTPASESAPTTPLSPYAITKLSAEYYLNFYRHQYGLNYTVLRYANVFGQRQTPYAEAGVVAIFMEKLIAGIVPVIYSFPDEPDGMIRDYCYVKDVVRANLMALTEGAGHVINIGTSVETTTGELYRTILECAREKGFAKEDKFSVPTKGPARPGDLRKSTMDISKAESVLSLKPLYSLKSGLSETFDFYMGKQYPKL
ncbi:NAD-dependent epimerase/dehydratase family protein [Candidatus Magnetomonas plexicatena]|uniref:NAD-dependent epimerase/dehydratase family protein n=1 Tax=Candidatus Magnetomonas plexicatena TaxID=2552947 RepID=UPI00110124D6|nr:NAD-dependent epimerase/dehydratase family protein [Nitrospirales bacterium LBB_01]